MIMEYVHGAVDFIHIHPHWGSALTFLVAFAESLAIVGTIVPGVVTMTAIGALVGAGIMPLTVTLVWAVLGAMTGDVISYWFGRVLKMRVHNIWPFRKHPKLLSTGERFFEKHGGKSVIIGRFIGPVRSLVPMIAGVLKMPIHRFALAAIPSATLWAISYMIPGILIGALSMELPPGMATHFILYTLLILFAIWLLYWLVKNICLYSWWMIDASVNKIWIRLRANRHYNWFTHALADPREPDHHKQMLLLILALFLSGLFIWSLYSVMSGGFITYLNRPIYHLLQSIRTQKLDSIMTVITLFGDRKVILTSALVLGAVFAAQKKWRAAQHWYMLLFLTLAIVLVIKQTIFSARPTSTIVGISRSSLPSGHTTFVLAFSSFLSLLLHPNLASMGRRISTFITITLTVLVVLSRLYLGGHWLSDIIVSIFLSIMSVLWITLLYQRKHTTPLDVKSISIYAGLIYCTIWIGYTFHAYQDTLQTYHLHVQEIRIKESLWWKQETNIIPVVRYNRLGKAIKPINVQWQGSLQEIESMLKDRGWHSHPTNITLKNVISRLSFTDPKLRLSLVAPQFHYRLPTLVMSKNGNNNDPVTLLRLWQSDITIIDQPPLWLGTIERYYPPHIRLIWGPKTEEAYFHDATKILLKDTNNKQTSIIKITDDLAKKVPSSWQWPGKILQIR